MSRVPRWLRLPKRLQPPKAFQRQLRRKAKHHWKAINRMARDLLDEELLQLRDSLTQEVVKRGLEGVVGEVESPEIEGGGSR